MLAFLAGPVGKYLIIGLGAVLLAGAAYLYVYHQGEAAAGAAAAAIALERARAAAKARAKVDNRPEAIDADPYNRDRL